MPRPLVAVFACALLLGFARVSSADTLQTPSATEVMQRALRRPQGRDFSAHAVWHLYKKDGTERTRETRILRRDALHDGSGYESQWMVVVDAPAPLRGLGLLVWTRAAGADDQWLYLPALQQIRRLGASDQDQTLLGSELTLDDFRERRVEDDDHVFVRSEERDGVALAVIDSTPRNPVAGYATRRSWVDLATGTMPRIEYFASDGRLARTLEARWTKVGDVWLWERIELRDERSGRRTVLELDRHAVDSGLAPELFTQASLRAGAR